MKAVYLGGRKNGELHEKYASLNNYIELLRQNRGHETKHSPFTTSHEPYSENYWLKMIKKNSEIKYFYIHEDLKEVDQIRELVDLYWDQASVVGYDFD